MIGEGLHDEVLRTLIEQHAMRECLMAKMAGGVERRLVSRSAEKVHPSLLK